MRFWALFAALALAHARPLRSQSALSGFVQPQGTGFEIDGSPFAIVASNCYYVLYNGQTAMSNLFAMASANGINVLRVWAYALSTDSGIAPFQTVVNGNLQVDTEALVALDQLLATAAQYQIRLILVLNNQWNAYGGVPAYNAAANHQYHDQYYTDPLTINWFKEYIQAVITRQNTLTGVAYANDPTIFAVELQNEPRLAGDVLPASPSASLSTISNWVAEMAGYAKSLNPQFMVALGDEGFFAWADNDDFTYNGSQGISFDTIINIDDIDYGCAHLYPDNWSKSMPWATQWIQDHITQAQKANKPVFVEEMALLDVSQRATVYRDWAQPLCNIGSASAVWMIADVVQGSMYPDYDHFTIYNTDSDVLSSMRICQ